MNPILRSIYYGYLIGWTPMDDAEAWEETRDVQLYIRETTFTTHNHIIQELIRRLTNG